MEEWKKYILEQQLEIIKRMYIRNFTGTIIMKNGELIGWYEMSEKEWDEYRKNKDEEFADAEEIQIEAPNW